MRHGVRLIAFASTLVMVAGFGVAHSPLAGAATPFPQCPSVGAAPSCDILVVINADSTVSVLGDPSVGPYDGGDDTLVGVQNNSTSYVPAITVTGPGSDLSGFDGDGLCTYGISGCPFGSTGYEGPGTSLVTDPTQPDSAEIDFGAAGLGPNLSAYFSLEGALTSASLTARKGGLGGYAALGDSYSSGEGLGSYGWNSNLTNNNCHRSSLGYPALLDTDRSLGNFTFVACSGAITDDIVNSNNEGNIDVNTNAAEAAQESALNSTTKTVTLTIGGNDVGFSDVLGHCVFGRVAHFFTFNDNGLCSQDSTLTQTVQNRLDALRGAATATTPAGKSIHSILSLLLAIHAAAPNARFYIAGYPLLFGSFKGECGIGSISSNKTVLGFGAPAAAKIHSQDAAWLNSVGTALNTNIQNAVSQAGVISGGQFTFVDANAKFDTHRLCDSSNSWISGISGAYNKDTNHLSVDSGSFHPTADGQRSGYESAFLATSIGQ